MSLTIVKAVAGEASEPWLVAVTFWAPLGAVGLAAP
jgi:hypothetical protein